MSVRPGTLPSSGCLCGSPCVSYASSETHVGDLGYRKDRQVDRTTAAAISKLLRASALITGVLLVMQALGFSIAGVLAFGGIGGIAVGFAARDLLANFFGALMIFLDRPFSVGDWIRSPDKEIEGTVEEVGWRLDAHPEPLTSGRYTSRTRCLRA